MKIDKVKTTVNYIKNTIPFKELILSQIVNGLMVIVTWLILGFTLGRYMGLIYTDYVLKEFYIILINSLIFFYLIDLLTPNPRKYFNIIGVALSEFFEHVVLLVGIILVIVIYPALWIWFIIYYVHMAFGAVLGRITSFKDWLKIFAMSIGFVFTFLIPDIIAWMATNFGVFYNITIPAFVVLPSLAYFFIKIKLRG